jgi:hypothetical protein
MATCAVSDRTRFGSVALDLSGARHTVLMELGHAPGSMAQQMANPVAADLRAAAEWMVSRPR